MKFETILPPGWPRPKGYANGVLVSGAARWLHVAGMIAWDENENIVGEGDFGAQFEKALSNVLEVVKAAGGQASNIVSMTVYVTDKDGYEADLASIGESWRNLIGRHYPAMALVQVASLLEKGAMVEIEARAALAE
ncbi:MAG: enamine deaminase RidA (YjgF/YER057c/UK114 family) [Planctomycetota bacterium]|jgi:enamine deaminase RidA (YjgF/YER057c/UK114 family)